MTTISEFVETQVKLHDLRSGDKNNPIVSHFNIDDKLYVVVIGQDEPSFVGIPINVIWVCLDSAKTDLFKKVFRRTSKNSDSVKHTRNTWEEITTYSDVFTGTQSYDLEGSFLLGELSTGNQIPNASKDVLGLVKLSVAASDANNPLAVVDNDPRMSDDRTPLTHTHALQATEQLKTSTVSIDVSQSPAPLAGHVLVVDAQGKGEWRFLTSADVFIPATVLTSIVITGQSTLFETDTNVQYVCTAFFDNGTSQVVVPTWDTSNHTVATIGNTGIIAIQSITTDSTVNVLASYSFGGITKTATKAVTITNINLLQSLSIAGPTIVNEGGTGTYTATAVLDNGTSQVVTPNWSLTNIASGATVTINSVGLLSATNTPSTFYATLTASYTQAGVTKTASVQVQIVDTPVTLTSIVVNGAASVYEGATSSYTITATYSNGTTATKNTGITWSMTVDTAAHISATGVLTALQVTGDQSDQVNASYTENGVTRTAVKAVTIKDNLPTSITISGATSVSENTASAYTATLVYTNGSTQDITSSVTWTANGGSFASNTYTAPTVTADTQYTITANYINGAINLSATKAVTVTNVVIPPKIHFGTASKAIFTAESDVLALPAASSNVTGQTFNFSIGAGLYGYFAIPSTVSNLAVTFTNTANQQVGGWDGAQGDPLTLYGTLDISGDNNGTPMTWHVYRTDWDSLGTSSFKVDF